MKAITAYRFCIYFFAVAIGLFKSGSCYAKEIAVCNNGACKTISAAIAQADSGDVIIVAPGKYKEGPITINKPITLKGTDWPVIDGENKYQTIIVTANHVTITGFNIINSGTANITDISAVRFQAVTDCHVINNHFDNNFFSIYFAASQHCSAENNTIKAYFTDETSSGNGVHLWKCENMIISGNDISGQRDGIYFEFVKESHIFHNISHHNIRYGLHFMFSDGNVYEDNHFRKNGAGVAVMYTHHIIMRGNTFEHNWGPSAYGLLLKDIDASEIIGNTFLQNTVGIYMEESGSLHLNDNIFRSNGWAMKIMANCTGDTITDNDFINNTFDVATNGTMSRNQFRKNYWEKYRGYDLNKDKIGDVPYRPVSLFSTIMEKVPNAVMLLRSTVSDILDQVEKVAPSVITESLTDDMPRMHQIHHEIRKTTDAEGKKDRKKNHREAFQYALASKETTLITDDTV